MNTFSYVYGNPLGYADIFGLSGAIFVRPVIVRPVVQPKPGVPRQKPGETIAQYGKRLEQSIRDQHRSGKPEIAQNVKPKTKEQNVNDSWFGILGRIIKQINKLDGLMSAPPVLPADANPSQCPVNEPNQEETVFTEECYTSGLCT